MSDLMIVVFSGETVSAAVVATVAADSVLVAAAVVVAVAAAAAAAVVVVVVVFVQGVFADFVVQIEFEQERGPGLECLSGN